MHQFQNILFVSHGIRDEMEGFKQALSLARNNQAALNVVIVCLELPDSHEEYKTSYGDFLKERIERAIQATKAELMISDKEPQITIDIDSASAVCIIRHVV